jgi:hypothetical protein
MFSMQRLLRFALFISLPVAVLAQNSVVSGQVRDAGGNPAASVRVALTSLNDNTGLPRSATLVRIVESDSAGMFRIEGVPPGRYGLMAGEVSSPTYFPGTLDASKAGVITVVAGSAIGNLNFALAAEPGPTLWTSTRIPPGPVPGPALYGLSGRIVVEPGGTQAIKAAAVEMFFADSPKTMTANVTFQAGSSSPASMKLEVTFAGVTGRLWHVTSVVPMPLAFAGAFRLSLPEGEYRVSQAGTRKSGGYYVKGISFGAADLMKNLMEFRRDTTDELVITLAECVDAENPPCN